MNEEISEWKICCRCGGGTKLSHNQAEDYENLNKIRGKRESALGEYLGDRKFSSWYLFED
jgi:hypothetical protein